MIDRALATHCRAAELLILDGMLCAAVTHALSYAAAEQIRVALGDLVDVKDYVREGEMERARLEVQRAKAAEREQIDSSQRATRTPASPTTEPSSMDLDDLGRTAERLESEGQHRAASRLRAAAEEIGRLRAKLAANAVTAAAAQFLTTITGIRPRNRRAG